MAFESMSEFFLMGKHGLYVWSTYTVSVMALLGLFIATRRHNSQLRKQLKKRYQREQDR